MQHSDRFLLVSALVAFCFVVSTGCAHLPRQSVPDDGPPPPDLAAVEAVTPGAEYRIGSSGICGTVEEDHIRVTRVLPSSPADGRIQVGDLVRGFQYRGLGNNIRKMVRKRIFRVGRDWDGKLVVTVERPSARDGKGNTLIFHLHLPRAPGALHHFGSTGLYGKVYPDHIVVEKVAEGSPADGVLNPSDRILRVGGAPVTPDIFRSSAKAIRKAEASDDGELSLALERPGDTEENPAPTRVSLPLETLPPASRSMPDNCPKTDAMVTTAADKIIAEEDYGRLGIGLLGLLATGEKAHLEHVGKVLRASDFAQPDVELSLSRSMTSWSYFYHAITLCEYYLLTGDDFVLPAIKAYAVTIAKGQDTAGLWNHRMADPAANFGQLHGRLYGYGAINQTSVGLWIALVLAEKCGVEHPEVSAAIAKTHALYANWIGKGALPYGNHGPMETTLTNNGTSGSVAVAFSLLGDARGARFYSRMSAAAHDEILTGHTGPFFNLLWSGLGANIAGPEALAAFHRKIRHLRTLTRTWDGRFLYMEARGGHFDYRGCSSTGATLLNLCAPRRALFITGKDSDHSLWLKGEEAREAVEAAEIDRLQFDENALLTRLGDTLPRVRLEAAQVLAVKGADVRSELAALLKSGTWEQRVGACCAIEQLKIAEFAPMLCDIACDANEDRWIRQKAATALQALDPPPQAYVPQLLEVIAREQHDDPFRDIDRAVGGVVNALAPDPYALDLDKEVFYQVVLSLLDHKHQWGRTNGMKLIRNIPLEDFHIVADKLVYVVLDTDRTYTSYHGDGHRQIGLEILNRLRIEEVIDLAVNTIQEKTGRVGPRVRGRTRLLKTFGAEAKPAIPRIKEVLGKQADPIVQAIEESEEARPMVPLEEAKAVGRSEP